MQKKRRFTKQQMEINSAMGTLQYGQILLDIVKGKILDIRENKMVNWINEFDKISANNSSIPSYSTTKKTFLCYCLHLIFKNNLLDKYLDLMI